MAKSKKADAHYFSWLVAYIDADKIGKVQEELTRREYKEITAYIPTVSVLKKTFKKRNTFEDVPLLFNYGFFRVPRKYAIYKNYLEQMQQDISCIYSWVKDPAKIIKKIPNLRLGERDFYPETEIPVATATAEEIAKLVNDAFDYSAHSAEDIARIEAGQIVTLHGYPFEGVQATIVEVNPKKELVTVKIELFDQMRNVEVKYDNVVFTIYHAKSYDDSVTVKSALNVTLEGDKQSFKKFRNETNQ